MPRSHLTPTMLALIPIALGIPAGASAPEILVEGLLDALAERFHLRVRAVGPGEEDVHFGIPKALTG